MDSASLPSQGPISHQVELYTARFFVQGAISGPFKRTSDLVNRKDRTVLSVAGAVITPLGQAAEPQRLGAPLIVRRSHIHFVASIPKETPTAPQTASPTGGEYYVQKAQYPCYALTDTFALYGLCHLHNDTSLATFMEMGEAFIPLTNVTIYLVARSNAPWRRDLVIVNKEQIEMIYLAEGGGA